MNSRRIKIQFLALGLPALAGFTIMYLIPFIRTLRYTVVDDTFWENFVGMKNYKGLFSDKWFLLALKNTAVFSLAGVTCLVLLSLLLSMGLQRLGKRLAFVKSLLIAPIVLPTAAIVFVWQMVFQNPSDPLVFDRMANDFKHMGGFGVVLPVYLLYIWKNTGLNIIILSAAIASVPAEMREAAVLDGAGRFRMFRSVTLPRISPVLSFVIMLSFSNSLKVFRESFLYYSPYGPPDAAYSISFYMDYYFGKFVFSKLTAGSVVFTLLIVAVLLVLYRWENKYNEKIY